ncbi:MAG: helix-turn-helix domain-containing protein [Thermoplasmatota archaeon]
MDCTQARARIPDAPPSAKQVLCTLIEESPLTMKDIQSRSGLARRTVYGAIRTLRDLGMLAEKPSLRDTRQTWFWPNI